MKSLQMIARDNEKAGTVFARTLLRRMGDDLIGKRVVTPAMGDYPGGESVVVEIRPDPAAPDIAFNVKHPTFGECGVFANERVRLA